VNANSLLGRRIPPLTFQGRLLIADLLKEAIVMHGKMKWALLLTVPLALMLSSAVHGQAAQKAVFTGYKGVTIGMAMDEARIKLGTPKDKSDTEDYYVYSDNETVQVLYAPDKTVRVLSINYIGKAAPTPMEVLGMNVEAKADGGIMKMVKYPKSGFWISYLKTGGDDPMTVITVQKMQEGEQ
jgi:hypothetical protein